MILGQQTVCVTNRCNLACTYCWYETGLAQYPDTMLDAAQYERWLAACAAHTPLRAAFLSGGEPTLRTDFPAVLRVFHDAFPTVVLLTNGTTTDHTLTSLLAELGTVVHVSVDHVGPGLADRVRGGTARTLRGLDDLVEAGIPTQVTMVLTARNHHDLRTVVDFCRERRLGLEVNPVAVPDAHPLAVTTLPEADRRRVAATLRDAGDLLGRPSYYLRVRRYLLTGELRPLSRCAAVATGVFVEADGRVGLCGQRGTGADRLGSVLSSTPEEIVAAHERAMSLRAPGPCVSLDCLTVA